MIKKVIILSGGFDPLHSGHIEMFKEAKNHGNYIVVCLNSDEWLIKKKGTNFLNVEERKSILESNKYVDKVITFQEDEFGSAIPGIEKAVYYFKNNVFDIDYGNGSLYQFEFYFANGGDRNKNTTPPLEQQYCEKNNIKLLWGIGGKKSNSSSWILNRYIDWHFEMTDRPWGKYKVLYQDSNKKIKLIEVDGNKSLSLQSHKQRSEHWVVVLGQAKVKLETETISQEIIINRNESIYVPCGAKHKLINNTNEILQVVEVQVGNYLGEDDIIRYD